ncbi:hypothetical protein OOJ91_13860 [Micromonospora lupini]|uniref:hypothetical protein n=1 Tax=Micromonospora lupini TaxID=285679 RepID=UPI002259A1B1|nr:hypothetical protein [Micromonospora lupini]MCX5066933.1 hypothetical protein [Micromonospora lupini]
MSADYDTAWRERFGRSSPSGALAALREAATIAGPPVLASPPTPRPDDEVLRMTTEYRWTARQVAAVLALDEQQVARILARHGRGPAREEGLAA